MAHDMEDVLGRLAVAIEALLANNKLAATNPSEVAITFDLGWHIREMFGNEWDVNGEYDRLGEDEKALLYPDRPKQKATDNIRPDIIVHKINEKNNLLVVEAKLSPRDLEHPYDEWKLRGLTWQQGEYAYFVGVQLSLFMPAQCVTRCRVFVDAAISDQWSDWLFERVPH